MFSLLTSRLKRKSKCSRPRRKLDHRACFEQLEERRLLAGFELSSLLAGDGSEGFVAKASPSSGSYLEDVSVAAAGDVNGDGFADFIVRDNLFNPIDQKGIDDVLRGAASQSAQEMDTEIVDSLRNNVMTGPSATPLDLASLNIQRGRDHGLETYNALRAALGLLPKEKFLTDGVLADGVTPNGVTTDVDLANALASVYDSVDDIDAWLGGLAEDPAPGTALSELVGAGLIEQFTRLRDGDRFYYENDPLLGTPEIEAVIDLDTINLQEIIELNTLARYNVSNIFVIPEPSGLSLLWLGMIAVAWRRRRWAR